MFVGMFFSKSGVMESHLYVYTNITGAEKEKKRARTREKEKQPYV
jgi:hypothetical protein